MLRLSRYCLSLTHHNITEDISGELITVLGVLEHKYVSGSSSLRSEADYDFFQNNCQETYSLEQMLNTQFPTDAHFTCYNLVGFPAWPRMNKSVLSDLRKEGEDLVLTHFAFDWDNTDHMEWTAESMQRFVNTLGTSLDPIISSWASVYTTAHGARIIYKLSTPVPVDIGEHHLTWMLNHFKQHGLDLIDDTCRDWTRLMRCPQVVRDNLQTWLQPYYKSIFQERVLDINSVGKMSPSVVAHRIETTAVKRQDCPTHEEMQSQLHGTNSVSQRRIQTAFNKTAKKRLKGTDYFDILFNDTMPAWREGERNNEICKMLGKIIPILLQKPSATPVQIFALAVQPLLCLGGGHDWVSHGWNALQDIYAREASIYNMQEEQRAEQASQNIQILNRMAEGMRKWSKDPQLNPDDEEISRQFVLANCIACVKGFYYTMGEDGFYTNFPVISQQLVPRIRKTFLAEIIETKKENYTGEVADVTSLSIQNDHSSPVLEIQMKPVGDMGGSIVDMNGKKPVLVMSTFCRNDDLEPEFNTFVNEWLFHLFGQDYETGCDWIGNALAFEEGLICALSLEGASSAGKKLLAIGLSECLKEPYIATPEDIYNQSAAFTKTPFLVVDESWPNTYGKTPPADKFKSLTGGDGMIVNEKYQPQMRILCPVRMLLTANDEGIVKTLTEGKNMGIDNRIAVGERLFHHKVDKKAAIYLERIGGREFTARKGQRWIRPDAGSELSDFILAKHFLWMYHNRRPVNRCQRFLVMGNCAPGGGQSGSKVVERMLADSNFTPVVTRAISDMIEADGITWKPFLRWDKDLTTVWVTREGVYKYAKHVLEERLSEAEIFAAMANILSTPEPLEVDGLNWYEIDIPILSRVACERGITASKINQFYVNRIAKGYSS